MWPDRRIIDLFGIEHPIVQAPMAGPGTPELAIAVAEAGGLGSLPCAMASPEQIRKDMGVIRQRTAKPINLNFFTHAPPRPDPDREARWKARLLPYYAELGVDPDKPVPRPGCSADVVIVLDTRRDVLRVPTFAVLEDRRVLLVERGKAVSRDVEVGLRNWEWCEILKGLEGGETVITSVDKEGVRPGAAVTVRAAAAKQERP